MNICPCLSYFFKKFQKQPQKARYQGIQQIEEEFLMKDELQNIGKQNKGIGSIKVKQKLPLYTEQVQEQRKKRDQETDLLSKQIDIALENTVVPLSVQTNIQDLINQELNFSPPQIVQTEIKQKSTSKQIDVSTFSLNLATEDVYYKIIDEKTRNLSEYFSQNLRWQSIPIDTLNKSNLKVYKMKNSKNNSFFTTFTLNCQYSYYVSLNKNEKVLLSLNNCISEMRVLQSFRPNLTKNLIRFKRIGVIEPIQLYYISYHNGSRKQNWEISVSFNDQLLQSNCQLLRVKNIIELENSIIVNEYIQFDLKANPASIVQRLKLEYLTYLNNLSSYINQNYQSELV